MREGLGKGTRQWFQYSTVDNFIRGGHLYIFFPNRRNTVGMIEKVTNALLSMWHCVTHCAGTHPR